MAPVPLGPHTFSTYNKCYWGENYTCIKNVHGIYFIKYINIIFEKYSRVLNMPGFWIYYYFKYVWVLNISGSWIWLWFWICQDSEQTRVLNKPGLWIYQGSEYASGSEFARVLNMPKYAWLCLTEYAWICLHIPQYARICQNLPE